MAVIMRGRLFTPLFLFIISIFAIVIGAILTVTILFIYIGLPLLIIGVILLVVSVLLFFGGTIHSIQSLFRPKRQKVHIQEKPKKKKDKRNIIDVEEEDGVYKAE
jgi:high-affinity Fe2+/Pb2+ permease|tara:strand:- start:838 stop:1152 length:315 start_codon:yes stop_codon:yes gene_type:complete